MPPIQLNLFVPTLVFPLSVFLSILAWPLVFVSAAAGIALCMTALRDARQDGGKTSAAPGWNDPSLRMRTGVALIAAPIVAVLIAVGGLGLFG